MSTVLHSKPVSHENLAEKLQFQTKLQVVTNKIHATKNIDEIILELSQDLCSLFNADRLTIYLASEDKGSIVSKVKTGLNSFKDIKLPINEQSIAGFVAANKRAINIRDVYDDAELKSYSAQLNFLKAVDAKTGYRTKQMLVAPVLEVKTKELIGVVQIINSKTGQPFLPVMEEGVVALCETLAIAFRQRQGSMMQVRTKYDGLVTNAVISAEELELAQRSSRRKNLDLETVLIDEFKVNLPALGSALSSYFGVPYEPYRADRVRPPDLMRNMSREFCLNSQWIPLEENADGIVIMAMDPEKTKASKMVNNVYPRRKIQFRVTTNREFAATLDHMFGGGTFEDPGDIGEILDALSTHFQAERLKKLCDVLRPKRVLEIGTYHGAGACYLGELAADYGGRVWTVDVPLNKQPAPNANVDALLARAEVKNVTVVRHPSGAQGWFDEFFQAGEAPLDLIYLDGSHTWGGTSCCLVLSWAALRNGGWLVLDDLAHPTYPDVGRVWRYVVPHLAGHRFVERELNWGFLMKLPPSKPSWRK